ncbi:hypothetical protein NC653_029262 [Populus alba x Populus x berolinensis]|uniref:Uncharacterized protein n=1 Tax=Populus alba x Populus x berolinensis TaxID=444605 RepID=A0AAD6M4E8_9ROSI|nr:hypothetical protein NC653_029262 [Populus alba x Populus x berolinensis]
MSIEDATAGPLKTQSPGRKRSKVVGTELPNTLPRKVGTTPAPSKRQYLTRSKATAIPCMGPQPKNPARVFQLLHSSDDSAPHPPSDGFYFAGLPVPVFSVPEKFSLCLILVCLSREVVPLHMLLELYLCSARCLDLVSPRSVFPFGMVGLLDLGNLFPNPSLLGCCLFC